MRNPLRVGFGFGLTSGIITTLGMIIGLNAATHSESAVVGGILTVAFADAFSDALGIHITEESNGKMSQNHTWRATISTFVSKITFALSFVIPFTLLNYDSAVLVSIIWAAIVIAIFSYFIGKQRGDNPMNAVVEHLTISAIVVIITQLLGAFISKYFS